MTSSDTSYIYGAMLLDMLSCVNGYGTDRKYDLGEGYAITFYEDHDVPLGYDIWHEGTQIMDYSLGILPTDTTVAAERPHVLAVARLLYAQADTIVARYLASLEAARPAAEAQLAKEMSDDT